MASTEIRGGLSYVKPEGQNMCLYAGVEILLKYNGVENFNQHNLFKINQNRVVKGIADTLQTIPDLKGLIIEYPATKECSLDKIRTYIRQDCPVLVNLYDRHHSDQGMGHSYIVKAYDDEIKVIRLVDPNQDVDQREISLSYDQFQQKWNNGPILELIAVRRNMSI